MKRRLRLYFTLATIVLAIGILLRVVDARYPWLWAYLADQFHPQTVQAAGGPTHILFTFVDHFEPHDQQTIDQWMADYPALARRHRDADGRPPQHSWFWYFSYADGRESFSYLQQLAQLTYQGFGEVELHLHHRDRTEQTFREKLSRMIQLSQWTGAMVTAEAHPRTAFGFIHGLWALDNSREGSCGINNELILLRQAGCYADFTHPSWGPMHPRIVNRLYYATDDPARPKSYDEGMLMRVGTPASGDLLIFEGPSVVRLRGWRPTYDHGDVTMADLPTAERIDDWIRTGIHVQGRPEWVFVKVYTHGAVAADHEAVLGEWADRMHGYLEERYNDGTRYVLHYVTAREAYNIAKAAEAGQQGNPNGYRDFAIAPPANRLLTASAPYDFIAAEPQRIVVRFLAEPGSRVDVRLRVPSVAVQGDATVVSQRASPEGTTFALITSGEGLVEFNPQPTAFASLEQRHD